MALTPRVSIYKVKKGDTLWHIANEQYGDPNVWREIKKANRLVRGNLLLVGQRLKLPVIMRPGPSGPSLPKRHSSGRPDSSEAGTTARAPRTPALKLPLEKIEVPLNLPPDAPFDVTVELKGELTFQEEEAFVEISPHGDFDFTAFRAQVANKNSGLFANGKVGFDIEKKTASLSLELSSVVKVDGHVFKTPTTGFGPLLPPDVIPPQVGWKFTYEAKAIEGKWRGVSFEGTFGFEVKVRSKQDRSSALRVPVLSPSAQIFLIGAVVIVAATLILAPEIIPVFALAGENSVAFTEVFTVLGARAVLK